MREHIKKSLAAEPKVLVRNLIILSIIVGAMGWSSSTVVFKGFSENGIVIARSIFTGILTPDLEFLFNLTKQGVPYLLLETISIAFLGTLIGSVLAIPLAFIASSNIIARPFNRIGIFLIAAVRTIPAFVYGLMFIRVAGPGPFTGVLTLSVTSIGMIAKLYIESIEDLDQGIIESLDAAGCNTLEKIRHGILPQLMTNFISTIIYRFEINLKNASILGLVGAGGIGFPLLTAMSSYKWHQAGSILVGLMVLVLIVERYSSKIRLQLARG